jgi:Flp pilus assembly protein TadD
MQTCQTLAGQPTDILPAADRTRLYAACTEYEASQRLNEDRPEGRANLADFLRRRGSITAAEDELLGGLKLEPASVPLSVNLADLYRAEGRDDEGEGVLRKAIALTPDSAALHHALGLTLIRRKQYADAVKQLGRAQVLAPDEPRYAYVYAVALQSTGDKETARRVVSGALTRNPADPQLLSWALQDAMSNGDSGRALPFARELAAVRPDDAAVAQLAAKLQGK